MARKKTEVPENETPVQRFKRVVEPRVGKAIKAISLVGSVSGSAYSYKPADVDKIMLALTDEIRKTKDRLAGKGGKASGFSLS